MRATAEQDEAKKEALEGRAGLNADIVDRLRDAATHALMDASRATVLEAAGVIEKLRKRIYLAEAALRADPMLTIHESQAIEDTAKYLEGKGLAYTRAVLVGLRARLGGGA